MVIIIIIIKAMNYTCYSSSLISIFGFFRSWKPPLMHPLSKHQSLHKLMLSPRKLTVGTKAKARVNGNGGKNSLVWNHFEKAKVEKDVTKAICTYC